MGAEQDEKSAAGMSAEGLKAHANEELKNANYAKAVELYTKAIEMDGSKAVFYANRAMAHTKCEAYGLAIADATRATELDPSYVKSHYRRATAYMALFQPREALKDFRIIAARLPNDKSALEKVKDCEKLIKRLNFEKAIEMGDPPSAADGLRLENMVVPSDYDGIRLEESMTFDFIQDMMDRFKNGKKLPLKYVYQIILAVKDVVTAEPPLVEIDISDDREIVVVGDTHGQYFDLLNIFAMNGMPSERKLYLFNGDFVDRGSWSTEVALLLYALKWLYPTSVFMNRGNHETDDMNKVYGFEGECKAKYNERVFKLFSESFSALPLGTLIAQKYFVLHGGLFSDDKITLDDVRKINRFKRRQPGQEGLMMEMLWTDPQEQPGRGPSKRGVGLQFGPDVTKRFCAANNIEAVIRSHEVRDEGYAIEHDGKCITVFSAPNYCDQTGNKGAVIRIGADHKLRYIQFEAVPHPAIKPMAYASSLMG